MESSSDNSDEEYIKAVRLMLFETAILKMYFVGAILKMCFFERVLLKKYFLRQQF